VNAKRKENRKSFEDRIEPLFSPRECFQLKLAYFISKNAHRPQVRKELDPVTRKPLRYFEHPRRVELILTDEFRCFDLVTLIVALLHDVLEDCSNVVSIEMIEACFGAEVARCVRMLTKDPQEGYVERLQSCGIWQVLIAKLADNLDNMRSLHAGTPEFQLKQAGETRMKYLPLFAELPNLAPTQYRPGIERALIELETIVSGYEAALGSPH
jgi:(p)ppGpp synthase/HD superfamily hydrolase